MLALVAVWAVSGGPAAQAQADASCERLLATAEERYVMREFEEARALAQTCLTRQDSADGSDVQAYRLLALVALRLGQRDEAERVARRLLSASPAYVPDPVQDPPAYVDLLTSVGATGLAEEAAPEAEPETEVEIVRSSPEPGEPPPPVAEPPAERRGGIARWLLVGGGVVAAGVAAVLLTSGGSSGAPAGDAPLPPPPAFPR